MIPSVSMKKPHQKNHKYGVKPMKLGPKKYAWLSVVLSLLLFFSLMLSCRKTESPPEAATSRDQIRLAVFYPSVGSLKALRALKEKGQLPPNLHVTGFYYELEKTNYTKARLYTKEVGLTWVKFHELRGHLSKENVFHENPFSSEFAQILKSSDGVILFGGADIPPYVYNNSLSLLTRIATPYRSFLETSFVFYLLGGFQDPAYKPLMDNKPEFPVIGLCLGLQSLNVGTGGTLVQDIWSEIYGKKYIEEVIKLGKNAWHTNPYASLFPEKELFPYELHPIRLIPDGFFVKTLGLNGSDTPSVFSAHHQMAGKLGMGFRTAATSMDGKVIEAIEHKRFPNVLGVQFHPESTMIWSSSKTWKFTPDQQKEVSVRDYLESTPVSMSFHKSLWAWFSKALKNSRDKRLNGQSH